MRTEEQRRKHREYMRAWNVSNSESMRATRKRYHERNREAMLERMREWKAAHPDYKREWYRKNADLDRVWVVARRAHLRRGMPKWADKTKMRAMYMEARRLSAETGVRHVVDHIVPLKHPMVCGLHCEGNMRIVTAFENGSKHNKFEAGV